MISPCLIAALFALLVLAALAEADTDADTVEAEAAADSAAADDELFRLSRLSLEELMSISVTSVAGIQESWFTTPASISFLTAEHVRRSGHQTLAEALRLVPGMHVAQVGSNSWRVESRGFTGVTIRSNKNLVLIDGRSVWDPLYSGVLWDVQDIVLEDLERIEVIRGPGATLWGANAVNGVINVTTKSAEDTQGLYLTGATGNYLQGLTAVRYGGQVDDDAWYRVWAKYTNFDNFAVRDGFEGFFGGRDEFPDDWSMGQGGFRIDGDGAEGSTYMLQGAAYNSPTYGGIATVPVPATSLLTEQVIGDGRVSGAHLLARVQHKDEPGSGWSAQTYYDMTKRLTVSGFEVERHTLDGELQRWFDWGERQSLIAGLRANYTADRTHDGPEIRLDPASDRHYTLSAFAQNTSEIIDDTLFAMIGSKIEYNDYTGVEVQPSGRVWWTPDDRNTFWAGISRAVRVPSRLELHGVYTSAFIDEGVFGGGPPTGTFIPLGFVGDEDLDSEELLAYEAGYRVKVTPDFTVDSSVFFHDYDNLIYTPAGDPSPTPAFTNAGTGESYGVHLGAGWQAADNWRLSASYSYVNVHHGGPVAQFEDINTPHHQAQLRSFLDVTKDLEFNAVLYYVDNLPAAAEVSRLRLDLGVTWRINEQWELAVWGQNLLDPGHSEASVLEAPRSVYIQATMRY